MQAGFWWENVSVRGHFENPRVYWKVILKWIFEKNGGVDWIGLTQHRDRL
jgi:hypothetical protein